MVEDADQYQTNNRNSNTNHNVALSSLTVVIFIAALLVDSLLSDLSSIVNKFLSEPARIVLFSTIVGIAIISGSSTILYIIRKIKTELGSRNKALLLISQIMPFIQYTILGLDTNYFANNFY
jgi:hypothetical protein